MIYVQRYWAIMDGLSVDALAGRSARLVECDERAALPI
jgi:hypothetical protein